MTLHHRSRSLLALGTLVAALLTAGLVFAQQSARAQQLPVDLPLTLPAVPKLPDDSKLAHGFALRDCETAPRASSYGVPGVDPRGANPRSANPLQGLTFFVDPTEPAWQKWESFKRRGMTREADLMWKVASQPRARWMGRWTRPRMKKKVREYLNCVQALQPGSVPLITVMRAQAKKCSKNYGGGGRGEDRRTRKWYRQFADAIGSARVVILFEPDSLGTIDCQKRSRRRARMKLLAYGVKEISKIPNATVYLEGGASDWESAKRTAWQLRAIGIRRVRGFMLNVTHYDWTSNNIRHGQKISRLTGGKPFVISTAFNGRGPVHYRKWINRSRHIWRTINVWCHPLKRGLGPVPTTDTQYRKVDAFLWIGRPGYSGGSCNGGPLPVGTFWPERALMYGAYATNWIGPPAGTRNGHYVRYSARALGYRPR
jgi:endoglucanase